MNQIGLELRRQRRKKHLSIEKLSEISGVCFKTISATENGAMPTLRSLAALCDVLNMEIFIRERKNGEASKCLE